MKFLTASLLTSGNWNFLNLPGCYIFSSFSNSCSTEVELDQIFAKNSDDAFVLKTIVNKEFMQKYLSFERTIFPSPSSMHWESDVTTELELERNVVVAN